MTREIKFRGKSTEGIWVFGNLAKTPYGTFIIPQNIVGDSIPQFKVHEGSVGQYTGLNDKNGKEIYEGDVCEVEYKSGKKFNNDIRFLNAAFTFRSYYLHRVAEDVLDEFCTIRVVGNINENPELAVVDS